jgi:methionine-rich copper-binding protein CopC
VEPAFGSVTVTNAAGNRVDDGKIAVDPHNAQELRVTLQPLAPSVYKVHWHTLSADKQLHPIERYPRPQRQLWGETVGKRVR